MYLYNNLGKDLLKFWRIHTFFSSETEGNSSFREATLITVPVKFVQVLTNLFLIYHNEPHLKECIMAINLSYGCSCSSNGDGQCKFLAF